MTETPETCEHCTYWRTAIGPERRICKRLGYVTGAMATCGWFTEALPFDDEPEEEGVRGDAER